jgi:hypothetical protein
MKIAGVFCGAIIVLAAGYVWLKGQPVPAAVAAMPAITNNAPAPKQNTPATPPVPVAVKPPSQPDRSDASNTVTSNPVAVKIKSGSEVTISTATTNQKPIVFFSRTNQNYGEPRRVTVTVGE